MTDPRFAVTPEPPYYAVIFSSRRTPGDHGYADMAEDMERRVARVAGFLGMESVRDAEGFGITVGYFANEAAIAEWKGEPEHRIAQNEGRRRWYEHFEVRVTKVERAYGGPAKRTGEPGAG